MRWFFIVLTGVEQFLLVVGDSQVETHVLTYYILSFLCFGCSG
jgi:hypothetical protein